MTTLAIVQARMGSTRLPGKVMKSLCGMSVLGHILHRLRRAKRLDGIVVATSRLSRDDVVAEEAVRHGAEIYRGDERDVLARYHEAARHFGAEWVVRVTADCPLVDPELVDAMLAKLGQHLAVGERIGFFSNTRPPTYPRGLDLEIFPRWALQQAHEQARQDYQREHVTPFIIEHPQFFPPRNFTAGEDRSHLRWTLDTPEDWLFFQAVYQALYRQGEIITTDAVMGLLARQPQLTALNAHVKQKDASAVS